MVCQKIVYYGGGGSLMTEVDGSLLEVVSRFDEKDDIDGFLEYIRSKPCETAEMLDAIRQLLGRRRIRFAFMLAMILEKSEYQHAIVSIALSIGGLVFNMPLEMERGMEKLENQVDALPITQIASLFNGVMTPMILGLSAWRLKPEHHGYMVKLIEISRLAIPHFRKIFDWHAQVPDLSWEEMRQRGREKACLVFNPLPPADAPRQRRNVIVFIKGENSRPRIVTAMNHYGWSAEGVDFGAWQEATIAPDSAFVSTIELCQQRDADILIMQMYDMIGPHIVKVQEMISDLRQRKPSFKVVAIMGDAWMINFQMLGDTPDSLEKVGGTAMNMKTMAPFIDAVWISDSSSLPLWSDPAFINKMLHSQMPHGLTPSLPDNKPVTLPLLFAGGVTGHIWPRGLWLSAIEHMQLPVKVQQHSCLTDGLPPLESYAIHFQRLREATCCLNLTMRQNMYCIVTHRSFEATLAGSLLIQEQGTITDMHRFFVSGEHYIEFETIAELAAVIRFISEHPEEAAEIRRNGNAFATEYYNDDKLVGYLDKFLFWP